jgi:hypothetical protein
MTIEKADARLAHRRWGGRVGTAKSDDGQIDLKLNRFAAKGGKGNGARIPDNLAIDSGVFLFALPSMDCHLIRTKKASVE